MSEIRDNFSCHPRLLIIDIIMCKDQRKTFQIINDHRYFLLINLISFNVLISYTDSSTNKTDRHDISETLLKVVCNTIPLTLS